MMLDHGDRHDVEDAASIRVLDVRQFFVAPSLIVGVLDFVIHLPAISKANAANASKAEFAQRLRNAMTAAGYVAKPAVLEREFNQRYWGKAVTLHGVRRWLCGETYPAQEKLLVLAEWLGVEPQVLRFGEGAVKTVRARRKRWDEGVGYAEREIFEAFLRLPVTQRKVVREVILAFSSKYPAGPADK